MDGFAEVAWGAWQASNEEDWGAGTGYYSGGKRCCGGCSWVVAQSKCAGVAQSAFLILTKHTQHMQLLSYMRASSHIY